mmetsp:Transcript_48715/g.136280  ORF Transcript_48715/g.136280 Transcript_48715/m.136280 type:complete len:448 (-) Transcript_48715:88-1431(-)
MAPYSFEDRGSVRLDVDDDAPIRHGQSSSKVRGLVGEIGSLEEHFVFLEERNRWLTSKMLALQNTKVSQVLGVTNRDRKVKLFKAWTKAMSAMRVEHQLQEQTLSLEKCQHVAHDLGIALGKEKQARMSVEAAANDFGDELARMRSSNEGLRRRLDQQRGQMDVLERRLQMAEAFITQKRGHALAVVEEGNAYDRKKRELETRSRDLDRFEQKQYSLEESSNLRQSAEDSMRRLSQQFPQSPLPHKSAPSGPPRSRSPEVERYPTSIPLQSPQRPMPPEAQQRPASLSPPRSALVSPMSGHRGVRPGPPEASPGSGRLGSWQQSMGDSSGANELFDMLDTDHNGVITRGELNSFLQHQAAKRDAMPNQRQSFGAHPVRTAPGEPGGISPMQQFRNVSPMAVSLPMQAAGRRGSADIYVPASRGGPMPQVASAGRFLLPTQSPQMATR